MILVTGAAGFIGAHVAKALVERGEEVIGIDNFNDYYDVSLKDARVKELIPDVPVHVGDLAYYDLDAIFNRRSYDAVIHLGAQAGVRHSIEDPWAYESSNCKGTLNVLEACRKHNVGTLIYASSSSASDFPSSLYGATKRYNELQAHAYHKLFGIHTTGLRFFSVYGPWGRPDMALWKWTEAILAGKPVEVYNHGNLRRDFTYIDDIVAGVLAALDHKHPNMVIDLGVGRSVDLMDMVNCVDEACGYRPSPALHLMDMQPGDVESTLADTARARTLLGWEAKVGIEEGVKRFVDWYKSYHLQ